MPSHEDIDRERIMLADIQARQAMRLREAGVVAKALEQANATHLPVLRTSAYRYDKDSTHSTTASGPGTSIRKLQRRRCTPRE